MAKLTVVYHIPDGDLCSNNRISCRLNTHGTVVCELFDTLLEERECDDGRYRCVKCNECIKEMEEEDND